MAERYWSAKCDALQKSLYTCPEHEIKARLDMVDDCIDAMIFASEIEAECSTENENG